MKQTLELKNVMHESVPPSPGGPRTPHLSNLSLHKLQLTGRASSNGISFDSDKGEFKEFIDVGSQTRQQTSMVSFEFVYLAQEIPATNSETKNPNSQKKITSLFCLVYDQRHYFGLGPILSADTVTDTETTFHRESLVTNSMGYFFNHRRAL